MPQIRALYLPHISHFVHHDLMELALQILDIVSIRPELKITYIGLQTKCYQILEVSPEPKGSNSEGTQAHGHVPHSGDEALSEIDEGHADPTEEEEDLSGSALNDLDPLSSDFSDGYDTESNDNSASRVHFRLQEILFYDDKISIFKARHGVI